MSRDPFERQYSLNTNITWMTVLKIVNRSNLCIFMRDRIAWNSSCKKNPLETLKKNRISRD